MTTPAVAPNEAYARIPNGGETLGALPLRDAGARERRALRAAAPARSPGRARLLSLPLARASRGARAAGDQRGGASPARFIEVANGGTATVTLADFVLRLAPLHPGDAPPAADGGAALAWPVATLAPGARVAVPVPAAAAAPLEADPEREGVVALFRSADGTLLDRVDFMRLPEGAALARAATTPGRLSAARWQLCTNATPDGETATCDAVPGREVGDRLHGMRTPKDFAALAEGATELGSESVKFVVDMQAGDAVHFLGTRRWPLHYTFIRERIYHQPALDRCDPVEDAAFNNGWYDFSNREYSQRRKPALPARHAGPLAGAGSRTMEFARGDYITGEQMRRAFFAVTARMPDPQAWAVRPQATPRARARVKSSTCATSRGRCRSSIRTRRSGGVSFQPLVAGVAYGVLRFVPAASWKTRRSAPASSSSPTRCRTTFRWSGGS